MKIHHNYLYILDKIRALGKNKTIRVAENTFYKPYKVIAKKFMEHFTSIQNLEYDYILFRLTSIGMVGAAQATQLPMIRQLLSWFCISFGFHIIICSNSK